MALLVAGCAGAPAGSGGETDGSGTGSSDSAAEESAAPSQLVGLWRVTVDGVVTDAWVQIGSTSSPGSLTYLGECEALHGSWRARAGAWLADVWASSGSCEEAGDAAWLERAVSYVTTSDGVTLLDASGTEVAALTVDGEPPANPDLSDDYRQPPELSEDQLAALDADPAPLPEGVEPASAADVVGRWLPLETYRTDPFMELAEDGTWTASDGCNGLAGRWVLAADGSLLATAGVQTLIGCEGHSLGSSLASSARLGLDGDRLTFYDAAGEVSDEARRG